MLSLSSISLKLTDFCSGSTKFLELVGVMTISLFFMSMVIFASSSLSPERDTSTDFERYCLDGVGGTWSWLVSVRMSCRMVLLDVTGDDEREDLSPGLDPGV